MDIPTALYRILELSLSAGLLLVVWLIVKAVKGKTGEVSKNGTSSIHALASEGIRILAELAKNATVQTEVLRKVADTNDKLVEDIAGMRGSLSIAMERQAANQAANMRATEEIRKEVSRK